MVQLRPYEEIRTSHIPPGERGSDVRLADLAIFLRKGALDPHERVSDLEALSPIDLRRMANGSHAVPRAVRNFLGANNRSLLDDSSPPLLPGRIDGSTALGGEDGLLFPQVIWSYFNAGKTGSGTLAQALLMFAERGVRETFRRNREPELFFRQRLGHYRLEFSGVEIEFDDLVARIRSERMKGDCESVHAVGATRLPFEEVSFRLEKMYTDALVARDVDSFDDLADGGSGRLRGLTDWQIS